MRRAGHLPLIDERLVGTRVEGLWIDPQTDVPGWYGATLVRFRPRARDFTMHFDDGMVRSTGSSCRRTPTRCGSSMSRPFACAPASDAPQTAVRVAHCRS